MKLAESTAKKIRACKTQSEVLDFVENMIPKEIRKKHFGYTFLEMAEIDDFEPWKEELIGLEAQWFEVHN